MASISYKEIEEKLKKLKDNPTSANEIGYILLDAFGMTKTSVERVRSGKMNLAHYEDGILVKKQLAYRAATSQKLSDTLEEMKADSKLLKQSPRMLAVSDGTTLLAYDPKENETYENKVAKLWLDFQFFYPLAGVEKYRGVSENPADVKAAEKMAKLYDEIRRFNDIASGEQVHDLNIFMTRLLFCYFAEDTGIFETNLFTSSVKRFTHDDGSDLSDYLDGCFNVMDQDIRVGVPSALAQFPYVNGGLFRKRIAIPKMGYRARNIILECGELSWSEINPDIFGSMIQAVVSPDMRAGLGMHYTSVPNIMKLIGPLFLNDLEEAFQVAKDSEKKLKALLLRISKMKFFDPACGSGNFLIIAYKELRNLEIRIWKQIREVTGQAIIPFVNIQLHQFYGIELDDFCHETAILSLWLAEHQMNNLFRKEFDVKIQALPLRPSGNIVCANACRIDWEDVCPHTKDEEVFIMGNPPYLGSSMQNEEQKIDKEIVLGNLNSYKDLDYIACWFYKGALFTKGTNSRYAFVSTNSICQGEQVAMLWEPIFELNLEIFFAHTSFKWTNNARSQAAVICVIVGVQNQKESMKDLYIGEIKRSVKGISCYLSEGTNLVVKKKGKAISQIPRMMYGNKATDDGNLILSGDEKDRLVTTLPEIKKYIRKFIGSQEFIRGEERWCIYIKDDQYNEAKQIEVLNVRFERTRKFRSESTEKATRNTSITPYKFFFSSYNETNSIIIPRHSSENREYIPIGFIDANTIIADSANAVYNAQMWIFGILTSKMHMAWVKTVGGRLKTDYRYSAQLCYNTFPFPEISEEKKKEIEEAAEEVLCVRAEHSEKTLAEMYDPDKMPADLRAAHHNLDLIVESCYRKELFTSDEERLEHLFKLYEKMTQKS
ncbi:class I SAM-dependent DNA methyltransferase [Macellibacteroides fermentans]|uniref:class I SAM-dependent DNA methyltransferase n=1 Tax=Macellibacteroides fermentans TaxID=879969 RepID=UPI00406C78F1